MGVRQCTPVMVLCFLSLVFSQYCGGTNNQKPGLQGFYRDSSYADLIKNSLIAKSSLPFLKEDEQFLLTVTLPNVGIFYTSGYQAPVATAVFYDIIKRKEPKDCLILDIGANSGYFSIFSSKLGCKVHSFEPQPIFGPYLETSKWLNGIGNRLVIHKNIASSDDKKVEKLKIERRESLLGLAQVVSIDDDRVLGDVVEVVTINDILKAEEGDGVTIDLMKIDVEGHELEVLKGAQYYLDRCLVKNILLELKPGPNYAETIRIFKKLEEKCDYQFKMFAEIYQSEKLDTKDLMLLANHVKEFVKPFDLSDEKPEHEDFWIYIP